MSAKARFLREFPISLRDDGAAMFVGAGTSMGAGYPSWKALLREIGEELGVSSDDVYDLAALAQWSVRKTASYTRVRQVIRDEIAPLKPIPDLLKTISRLPVRHVWTTNYDTLIERAFAEIGRPIDPVSASSDLALKPRPGATRLYKMHGSVDRLDDIVISTDDYELFKHRRGAYLPLLQAHLTSLSVLFVGLSFTDPNVRHVLSLIRESFTDAPPEHFAIVRPPQRTDFSTPEEFSARLIQHKLWADDLLRYGLVAVEIDDYDEAPELLREVERRVARNRVWISGSWPVEGEGSDQTAKVYEVSEKLGRGIGQAELSLVSGSGLVVGSATMAGFLSALQTSGGWDLERRLVVRPFPQPIPGGVADRSQWNQLRQELARLAGVAVFVGGTKNANGPLIEADGVIAEFEACLANGLFLVPIGATGGAAKTIATKLIGSSLSSSGAARQRPSDDDLVALSDEKLTSSELAELAIKIVKSFAK